jgi:RNA polymerase sigma-70 factor, ECF subfamily
VTRLPADLLAPLFAEHRTFLWGLCYRLTGCAADAEDIVQETFIRVLEHPPARTDEPWRPWLVRVAVNLGRDLLRRRKRRGYVGPWLPSPIETGDEASPPSSDIADGQSSPEGRYDLMESVSFAFLLALEALTPQQRAVLLLRDVFDYSVQETAEAIDLSEANVKTTHHRARRIMQSYDRNRCLPTRTLQEQTHHALERFLSSFATHDMTAIEKLLAADVRILSDGGGEFLAALKPVVGRDKIMRFYTKAFARSRPIASSDIRFLNGLPTLIVEFADKHPREAPAVVQQLTLAPDGRIQQIYAILAPRKLTAVHFVSGGSCDDTRNE